MYSGSFADTFNAVEMDAQPYAKITELGLRIISHHRCGLCIVLIGANTAIHKFLDGGINDE